MNREALWILGIDPGLTGAALAAPPVGVEVAGERRPVPTVLWTWRPRRQLLQDVFEVCVVQSVPGESVLHERREVLPTLNAIGVLIRKGMSARSGAPSWRLRVEGPHVTPKNPRSGLSIAMTIGRLVGPMEIHTGRPTLDQPAEWRAAVLHLPPRTPRDRAKRVSLREMPLRLPPLVPFLDAVMRLHGVERKKLDHVTDAAGLMEYGFRGGKQGVQDEEEG